MRPSIQPKKKTHISDKASKRNQEVRDILSVMPEEKITELLEQLSLVKITPIFKKKYTTTQQKVRIIHTCELCGSVQVECTMINRLGMGLDDSERIINNTRTHCPDCVERLMLEEKNMLIIKLLSLVDKYEKKISM